MDDFEEPRVTIRSLSGGWVQEGVLARNDPVFRNIGMMHKNGVVVLDNELSRAFEGQWPHYLRLKAWMEEFTRSRRGRLQGLQPMEVRDALRGDRSVEKVNVHLVYLHQVDELSRLITMPQGWELCVGVSEVTDTKKAGAHLLRMGTAMVTRGFANDVGTLAKPGEDSGLSLQFLWQLLGVISRKKPKGDDRALSIYWGLMRNSLLRTIEEYPLKRIAWPTVLWSTIPHLLSLFSIEDEGISNFVSYMTDDVTKLEGRMTVATVAWKELSPFSRVKTLDEVRGMELYAKSLRLFAEDAEPAELGLLAKMSYDSPYSRVERIAYHEHLGLTRKQGESTEEYAKRFSSAVGSVGTTRVLLSLLHYLEREGMNDDVDELASAFEVILEGAIAEPEALEL